MKASRRALLKTSALCGAAAALAGCERWLTQSAQLFGEAVPETLPPPQDVSIDADFHLLSRAGFGPRPGDLQRLRSLGPDAWLEEQLQPTTLSDTACDLRAERFESLYFSPGDAYGFRKPVLREELTRHALLRAVYSRRQLFEAMVEFWSDHLNIDLEKGDCVYLKPSDDRVVIRKHALGNFPQLLRASATSPAMLVYLDGRSNKVRKNSGDRPNENYARELLELHTLGLHNGYSQQDVLEAARCLSGWTFDARRTFAANQNESFFRSDWHDDGPKQVLGETIPAGGGPKDLDALLRIVCAHPGTARFLAAKLCRHFVSHTPPASLVEKTAQEFTRTAGDIKSLLRLLFKSEEFYASRGQLLKRPFKFMVSALRAIAADTHAAPGTLEPLHRMGHGLFQHPSPDGYPSTELPWMGTLMWRWNFALTLAGNQQPGVRVNLEPLARALGIQLKTPGANAWFAHLTGRTPSKEEAEALELSLRGVGGENRGPDAATAVAVGLALASPSFQRC